MPSLPPKMYVLFAVTTLLACDCNKSQAATGPKPTSAECEKLFQHEAELIAPKGASAEVIDAARVSLVKSDTTSQWCEAMSRGAYDCSMKATSKAAFDACRN